MTIFKVEWFLLIFTFFDFELGLRQIMRIFAALIQSIELTYKHWYYQENNISK